MPFDTPSATATQYSVFPVELREIVYAVDGKRLIDGLTLRLDAAPATVVMGPNGAGKSLTLRLLQGLLSPRSGRILWAGHETNAASPRKSAIVFQRPVLLRRSVAANLAHALRVYGWSGHGRSKRIGDLLVMAGLEELRDRPARVLSGGEQQRLSVVRALAAEPELLLLDEPTASLDPRSTAAIERLLTEARSRGTKILLVTHDVGQAKRLADEIVFIHRGRVAEHTPASEFFAAPRSEAARAYLDGRLLL